MATIKREFIFVGCLLSALGAIFALVALVTEQWVVTDNVRWVDSTIVTKPNTVKYGLFQGYYDQQEPVPQILQITMTCLVNENVCALLCGRDDEDRYTLLKQLYNNDENASQHDSACPSVRRSFTYQSIPTSALGADENSNRKFINAGVWVSTIFFLATSIAFGTLSSALAIWNTVSNPIQAYFSIMGLYIYNACALAYVVIAMCLWGIMHISITFHNVSIFYTLNGQMSSDKTASLGYSFWILFLPIVCYCGSMVLLYVRQYLLSRDPGHKMVQREDTADPGIYLY